MSGFDWEVPHTCQFEVPGGWDGRECGDPAPYYVWWHTEGHTLDEDYHSGIWVCEEHWKYIAMKEDE